MAWVKRLDSRAPRDLADLAVVVCGRLAVALAEEEADLLQQRREEVFFLQKRVYFFAGIDRAVAGDDDHRRLRALVMDLLRELETVHAFHAEVGHQDVEIVLAELFQRLFGVVSGDGAISLHFQDLAAQSCQHLMVVYKEDGFHVASCSLACGKFERTGAVERPSWLPSTLFLKST